MDRAMPGQPQAHSSLPAIIEIALVVLWALVVARPLINLDPQIIPTGREYGFSVQSHHL